MAATPITRVPQSGALAAGSATFPAPASGGASVHKKDKDWTQIVAAGSVVAGGVLMVTGHKRAGLAVAAIGSMVALLEEPEAIEGWWKNMSGYLNGAEQLLDKVEGYIAEASKQGRRVQTILHR